MSIALESVLGNESLRSEYRLRVANAIQRADNYAGDELACDELVGVLSNLEGWLKGVFGGENAKMFDPEVEDLVVARWADGLNIRIEDVLDFADLSYKQHVREWLSKVEEGEDVILVTKEGLVKRESEEAGIWCEPQFQDRLVRFMAALRRKGLQMEEVNMFKGVVTKDMMRKLSYVVIEIPSLNKQVLINDQIGEGTFVIEGMVEHETLFSHSKQQLKDLLGDRFIKIVCRNQDRWIGEIFEYLFEGKKEEEVHKRSVKKMDAAYFNAENVRRDLEAYAKALGLDSVENLSTRNLVEAEVNCANGEGVKGATYLNRAGVALGLSETQRESKKQAALVLERLKMLIGIEVVKYPKMDATYFNEENVRRDLEAYAKALGLDSVENLSTRNLVEVKVNCANGEGVKGGNYLNRAGVALGLSETQRDAGNQRSLILEKLKMLIGIKVVKYPKIIGD